MRLPGSAIACYLAAGAFAAALTISSVAHAGQEQAAHSATVPASAAAQQAKEQTLALLEQTRRWKAAASGAEKSGAQKKLAELARSRAQSLAKLAQTNPQAVLELAISEEQRSGMPAEVQAMLEQRFEAEGTVEAYYEDYEDGSHRLRHFLTTPAGERMSLHLAGPHSDLNSGDEIQAEGVLLETEQQGLSYQAFTADGSTTTATAAPTQTTGDQRTLVLMVNFEDDSSQPFTEAELSNAIFGTASDFLYENSFGQLSLSGEVHGWLTLPMSAEICDTSSLMILAGEAAISQGIDTANYQRVVYAFPRNACGWSGLASLGGNPSRVLLNGTASIHNATHEIGHTLGLRHAHTWECGSEVLSDTCVHQEYGDSLDNMGSRFAHYNGFHKEQLGWLPAGSIQVADSAGVYELEPYAQAPGAQPKVLKVLRNIDPATGLPNWFYLEYRRAIGFDRIIEDDGAYDVANIHNGVIVRTGTEGNSHSSYLLDMTPDSYYGGRDFYDVALEVGYGYTDPDSGVTITAEYADEGRLRLYIEPGMSEAQCQPAAPLVALEPEAGNSGAAGESLGYRLTVTNGDSRDCDMARFALTAVMPEGWSGVLAAEYFELAPGESGHTLLTMDIPQGTADGDYGVAARVEHDGNGYAADALVSVSNPTPNQAPVAMDDSAELAGDSITLAVLGNDYDPDGDAIQVTEVTQGNKGSVRLNKDGTLTYTPGKRFKGNDSFSYTISDGRLVARGLVTIASASGGNGNSNGKGNRK